MQTRSILAAIAVVLLAGCGARDAYRMTPQKEAAFGRIGGQFGTLFNNLYSEGEWGAVLNLNRLAIGALEAGNRQLAKAALDRSIARIETIYADDPTAKKARSLWTAEGTKDFKGEPYERAMTYYYRGVLYLADGEYDNARAAFRAAEYQDTVAEKEEFSGDFGLMTLLAGWATQCEGDLVRAQEYYDRAATQTPGISLPSPTSDTLVLVEAGASPTKQARGRYGEALTILGSRATPPTSVNFAHMELALQGNVEFQATTRGGRQVDSILAGKASFKGTTETVGNVAMATGVGLMQAASFTSNLDHMQNLGIAGAAVGLIGLLSSAASSATKAQADTRYWDTLPSRIYGAFLPVGTPYAIGGAPAPITLQEMLPVESALVDDDEIDPVLDARAGRCRTIVARNGLDAHGMAPSNFSPPEKNKIIARNAKRDLQFRKELQELFDTASVQTAQAGGN